MKLPEEDATLFYRLYHSLLYYVNTKYDVADVASPEEIKEALRIELKILIDELYEHPKVINEFVQENPCNFSSDELQIVKGWNNFVKREFAILHQLEKYTIFLDVEKPPKAYGVFGLYSTFEKLVGPLPTMMYAVLLSFKGKIIYDGFFSATACH